MKKHRASILLLAIITRCFFMFSFYHPDTKSQYFHYQYLSQGITNIYSYLNQNKYNLPYTDTFNYFPLPYFIFGSYSAINKLLLGPNFVFWLNDWGPDQLSSPNMNLYLFFLKLPYLLADLAIAYFFYRLWPQKKLYLIWLFNPLSLYLIYIVGNFDILPSMLVFASLYYYPRRHPRLSYFLLGLAVSLKTYPLLFLPFLYLSTPKPLKNLPFFILPIFITILPFLPDPSFLDSFLGSGLTQKLFHSPSTNLPLFPLFYVVIFFLYRQYSQNTKISPHYHFLMFLLFISTVGFHPQWLLWFLPLLLPLTLSSLSFRQLIIPFTLALVFIFLTNDAFLFWGHLIPIDPGFISISSPYLIISHRTLFRPENIQNAIQYILLINFLIHLFRYARKT